MKKLLGLMLITGILLSTTHVSAQNTNNEATQNEDVDFEGEFEWDIRDFLKDGLDEETLNKVYGLVNQIEELEEHEDWDNADKLWEQLDSMDVFLEEDFEDFDEFTFEDAKEFLKADLDANTLKEVETIFNQIIELEEQENWEEADKLWEQLDSMDVFLEEDFDEFTFEEVKEFLKTDLNENTLKEVETIFNQIFELEGQEKWEEADKLWEQLDSMDVFLEEDFEEFTFEDAKEFLKSDLDENTLKEVETIFNQIIELEEQENWEEADKLWEQLESMDVFGDVDYEDVEFEEITFDEVKEYLKDNLDSRTLAEVEFIFNQIIDLEKQGDFDEADKLWEQLESMNVFEDEDLED